MKWALGIVIGLLVLLAVSVRVAPSILLDRVIAQAEQSVEADGGELTYDRIERSEGLFSTERRFHALSVQQPGGVLVTAETFDVSVPAWDWRRAHWRSESAIRAEEPGNWILTASQPNTSTLFGLTGQLETLDFAAPAARFDSPAAGFSISLQSPTADYGRTTSPGGGTVLQASASRVEGQPLALALENVRLNGTIEPPWPTDPGPTAIEIWRDSGGTVEIIDIHADLPKGATLDLQATLQLDQALQPTGDGQVSIGNYESVIDFLIERGLMDQDAAVMIKLTVGLIAAADEDGDPAALTMPLRIENGQLFAGEFLIGPVPPVF
ncbi:MAG: DUF2125 domain-containing protein [Pseudomonadota bacterium]